MRHAGIAPVEAYRALAVNIQHVIQGKPGVVRNAVVAMFAEGHILIEDVPGLGKTTLARCLAASVAGRISRIQFTPDLLPGDVTGSTVFHQSTEDLRFHPGAVFANIVLADEINRGTPKTQSALLEVMAEHRVTVDGHAYEVPRPFLVVATQNPVELDGTHRLPEAQLDRFLMRFSVGYPDHDAEVDVVVDDQAGPRAGDLAPVLSLAELGAVIADVRRLHAHRAVCDYAVRLAGATRAHHRTRLGASPRGSVALIRAARAWAATEGRDHVTPADVKAVAHPVLDHRVILTPDAELSGHRAAGVVDEVLAAVAVPTRADR